MVNSFPKKTEESALRFLIPRMLQQTSEHGEHNVSQGGRPGGADGTAASISPVSCGTHDCLNSDQCEFRSKLHLPMFTTLSL